MFLKTQSILYPNGQTTYLQQCSLDCSISTTISTMTTSSSISSTCCLTSNCNNINLTPVVSSCYLSATYYSVITKSSGQVSSGYGTCVSPKNQYCIWSYGYDFISNNYVSVFSCSDSCPDSTSSLTIGCCRSNNCNLPGIQC